MYQHMPSSRAGQETLKDIDFTGFFVDCLDFLKTKIAIWMQELTGQQHLLFTSSRAVLCMDTLQYSHRSRG